MKLAWDQVYEHAVRSAANSWWNFESDCTFYGTERYGCLNTGSLYGNIQKKGKKALKMSEFLKLSQIWFEKYAEVLNVTPEELVNIERIRNTNYESWF